MTKYLIKREDESGLIATTYEWQEFDTVEQLDDFCYEISDSRWFTVMHIIDPFEGLPETFGIDDLRQTEFYIQRRVMK